MRFTGGFGLRFGFRVGFGIVVPFIEKFQYRGSIAIVIGVGGQHHAVAGAVPANAAMESRDAFRRAWRRKAKTGAIGQRRFWSSRRRACTFRS